MRMLPCIAALTAVVVALVLMPAHAADPNPATIYSEGGAWPLYRQWTPAESHHFAKWIHHIYEMKRDGSPDQQLAKIEDVLTDPQMNLLMDPEFAGTPSNPQLDSASMHAMHQILDCGKLTISLGGYYAYRRGLPWMLTRIRSGDGSDIRTSPYNTVANADSVLAYETPLALFRDAVQGFCTGNYRIEPDKPWSELSDTAPVAIQPEFLIPGTLFYLDGHVMIVADIDDYGDVYFLDSTTARTRDIYTHQGLNAVTGITPRDTSADDPYAGCYRGFRVIRYPIAETAEDGKVLRVRRRTDEEMKAFGYSLEQYAILEQVNKNQKITADGMTVGTFHDFIRLRMRTKDLIAPLEMMQAAADDLLRQVVTREQRVQEGWRYVRDNGPIPFPEAEGIENVFNKKGIWRDYATATSDADFRLRYFDLLSKMDNVIDWYKRYPQVVQLDGYWKSQVSSPKDFAARMIHAKNRVFGERTFNYTNSRGQKVRLSLLDVEQRLFDLSFDPNHPPELRWGAKPGTAEARTAIESPTPLAEGGVVPMREAYAKQAYYRSLTHRESEESFLTSMFTEGFPTQDKYDTYLRYRWKTPLTPPVREATPDVMRLARKDGKKRSS